MVQGSWIRVWTVEANTEEEALETAKRVTRRELVSVAREVGK
jgi:hypothetical protein